MRARVHLLVLVLLLLWSNLSINEPLDSESPSARVVGRKVLSKISKLCVVVPRPIGMESFSISYSFH